VASGEPRPFDCNRCRWGRHCDETNPAPFAQWQIPGVIASRTCLLPMVQPWAHRMMMLHRHYRNGRYPLSGGLLEQPNFYIEAMAVIDGVTAEIEAGRAERARRER